MPTALLSVPERLAQLARQAPDRPALTVGQSCWTRVALDSQASRIANRLLTMDIAPGQRVAIASRNTAGYLPALLGIVRAGMSAVPLPLLIGAHAQAAMLRDSEARLLFTDTAEGAPPGFDGPIVTWAQLDDWLADISDTPPARQFAPDDEFNIVYSSGTTGQPKGIRHSHGFRSGDAAELGSLGFAPDGTSVITTAMYSNWSLYAFLATLQSGGHAVVMESFDIDELLNLCSSMQPANVFLVPVQCQRLLAHPALDSTELGARTLKWVAGSPLAPQLKRELLERWPGGLNEIYGMSEGAPSTTLQAHRHPDKLDSVGRPGPNMRIRILGEDGRALPAGEIGEIAGHGPSMMLGYNRLPEATAALSWHDEDGSLFFRSGDLGFVDDEGFLHVVGRAKDMIISGGFNIYPPDLEAVLEQHPAVAEAAVIGTSSARWGETPLGIVSPRDGARITAAELRDWANARLGKVQRLADVVFCDELPRNTMGKVLKAVLRERFDRYLETTETT